MLTASYYASESEDKKYTYVEKVDHSCEEVKRIARKRTARNLFNKEVILGKKHSEWNLLNSNGIRRNLV